MHQHNTNTDACEPLSPPPKSWNRTAVLSAMFCIPFCCPPMTLLGVGAGALALRSVRKNQDTKGAWLAWSSISFGVLATVLSTWLYWISGLRTIVLGPTVALAPLFASDTEGMSREWDGPATTLTREQLNQFASQVTERYGTFVSAKVSDQRPTPLEQSWKRSMVVIPIQIQFSLETVQADLGLERFDDKTGKGSMVWRSLRIIDPVRGNLHFPDGEPAPPELPPMPQEKSDLKASSNRLNNNAEPPKPRPVSTP